MRRGVLFLLPLLALALAPWEAVRPNFAWSFPRDHWAHREYRNEWWYFTGQLRSGADPQPRFGYQFTFFRVGIRPGKEKAASSWSSRHLIMGHAALTDLKRGAHLFSEILTRESPLLGGFGDFPDPRLAWSLAPAGTREEWTLRWNGRGFDVRMRDDRLKMGFDLGTAPRKPLIFEGPGGYSSKSRSGERASLYYSFTRLAVEGEVRFQGRAYRVQGSGWMDREISSGTLGPEQAGWDWFGLQLTGSRELMLYRLRRRSGETDVLRATLVGPRGQCRYLEASQVRLEALGSWHSPESGITYPAGWRIRVRDTDLDLRIVPRVANQENRSRQVEHLNYWEGAVRVLSPRGLPLGSGYVELTGYGAGSRPPV